MKSVKILLLFLMFLVLSLRAETVEVKSNLIKSNAVIGCGSTRPLNLPSLMDMIEDDNGVDMSYHGSDVVFGSPYSYIKVAHLDEDKKRFKINPEIKIAGALKYCDSGNACSAQRLAHYVNLREPDEGKKIDDKLYEFNLPFKFFDEDAVLYGYYNYPKYASDKYYYHQRLSGDVLLERVAKIKAECSFKLIVPSESYSKIFNAKIVEICNGQESVAELECVIN